ncbi:MAG: 30S ribosome-binding factor RbfA [Phycisphaerae bacterium]
MSRRTQRVSNLIRNALAEILHKRLADPRIDPARTSITRVEVPEDLMTAKVYVSVMGTEGQQRKTIAALQHARGHLQELLGREISLRHTPVLQIEFDKQFKKTIETLELIQQAMDEIDRKQSESAPDAQGPEEDS